MSDDWFASHAGASDPEGRRALKFVTHLIEAAGTDTFYRDIYLERGRECFTPLLSHREYLGLARDKKAVDDLLRKSRTSVEWEDWTGIRELANRIRTLRQCMDGRQPLLELGREVYEPTVVLVNPFSASIGQFSAVFDGRLAERCGNLITILSALEGEDPSWRDFYAERRTHFLGLSESMRSGLPAARVDRRLIRREALQAAVNGNIELLDALAKKMLESEFDPPPQTPSMRNHPDETSDACGRFPAEAVAKARRWGLVSLRLTTNPAVDRFLHRVVRKPKRQDLESGSDRRRRFRNLRGVEVGPTHLRALMEALDYITTCPLITSCGDRYRPAFADEDVLVEDFPEGGTDPPESDLLHALGIRRRKGMSRLEVDQALLRQGLAFLKNHLGLDPVEFRLVCIPPDIYARLGADRQWGHQAGLWTHFDGYQVIKGGALRALVGGDARFGGIFDLCSIGSMDEREGVILRFAVVRRKRLFTPIR